jgi:hypothetical protein
MILYFKNPVFKYGVNITVRRGTKWSGREGKAVACGTGNKEYVPINIQGTKVMKFSDISDFDLENEHDPTCRNVSGLLKVMEEIYCCFTIKEVVTLVYFEVVK